MNKAKLNFKKYTKRDLTRRRVLCAYTGECWYSSSMCHGINIKHKWPRQGSREANYTSSPLSPLLQI